MEQTILEHSIVREDVGLPSGVIHYTAKCHCGWEYKAVDISIIEQQQAQHIAQSKLIDLCNACDEAPMAEGQTSPSQPGYCEDCLEDWREDLALTEEGIFDLLCQSLDEGTGEVRSYSSYSEGGYLTNNAGGEIVLENGQRFQITIVENRREF